MKTKRFWQGIAGVLIMAVCVPILSWGSTQVPVHVKWVNGANGVQPNRRAVTVVVTNISGETLGSDWAVGFNHFDNVMEPVGNPAVTIAKYPPEYFMLVPSASYKPLVPGDSVVCEFLFSGSFPGVCYYPDGEHYIANGDWRNPVAMEFEFPVLNDPAQWTNPANPVVNYPDGNYVYAFNNSINPEGVSLAGSVYDHVFPAPKSIKLTGGNAELPAAVCVEAQDASLDKARRYAVRKLVDNGIKRDDKAAFKINLKLDPTVSQESEYYELVVGIDSVTITAVSVDGALNGVKTLIAAIELGGTTIPTVEISDYPDLSYRGMMLDVARNYTKLSDVKWLVDILASYKINRFHFHLFEDEAWRLEIPGLPELTEIGSRKGCDLEERESLLQTYAGSGNPDDPSTSANGYITRQQFVEFLQYADALGVEVIPEIDTPGHSRAAIIAMRNRYNRLIDIDPQEAERYKMWDDDDTSSYYSAQGYGDNVLNVAMEGTYNFVEKIFDEIKAMYDDAGVLLRIFHFGGDEVAHGAWEGSPLVRQFMADHGMTTVQEAAEYYVDRISEYISSKGVLCGGWQEAALGHSAEFNARVAPRFGMVNAWSTIGKADVVPYTIANDGYPVIMSNVSNFYIDIMYSRHQSEFGLNWGGWCNEFTTWSAQPFNVYRSAREDMSGRPVDLAKAAEGKPTLANRSNVVGVQAQLWAETIRNFEMVQLFVLPKILGLAERGWNAEPVWAEDYDDMTRYNAERAQYNLKIGLSELPRLSRKGAKFHVNQPGIIVEDGILKANTCYPGIEVRYTLDGSEPDSSSPLWTEPVAVGDEKLIKARAYYLGRESVTTFLFR